MAKSAGRKQKIVPHIPGTLEEITKAVLSPDFQFIQKQKQKVKNLINLNSYIIFGT